MNDFELRGTGKSRTQQLFLLSGVPLLPTASDNAVSVASPGPPIKAASIEQARLLRGFSTTEFAHKISVTRQTYNRYLNEGFPTDFQEILSSVLTVPAKFLSTFHPEVFEASNINFLAGRKATAVHRAAAIANDNLLTQIGSWIRTTYTVPGLDRVDLSNETPKLAAQLLR